MILVDPQVAFRRGRGADLHRLIRHLYVEGGAVCLRVHGDAGDVGFSQRPDDTDSDFAAVGNQYFPEKTHGRREKLILLLLMGSTAP